MKIKISASIMAENFTQESVDRAKSADFIHFDIMNGTFVPQQSIWSELVDKLETELPKDVHLMIDNPEEYVDEFIDAGASRVAFHAEATDVPESVIGLIHLKNAEAGLAINPESDLKKLFPLIEEVDYVLIMSVNPGKGGQKFIDDVLKKVIVIRDKFPDLDIAIDGGIDNVTAKKAVDAGANILVTGTYIFSDNTEKKIRELRMPS
ncbi:ribulose-phosphate 3-epimerase [Bacteroidota bacterium]